MSSKFQAIAREAVAKEHDPYASLPTWKRHLLAHIDEIIASRHTGGVVIFWDGAGINVHRTTMPTRISISELPS